MKSVHLYSATYFTHMRQLQHMLSPHCAYTHTIAQQHYAFELEYEVVPRFTAAICLTAVLLQPEVYCVHNPSVRLFGLSACRRMTAREAQGHQWLNHKRSRTTLHFQPLTQDVTERLKSYKDQSVLKV
jgi:hypothetical protein